MDGELIQDFTYHNGTNTHNVATLTLGSRPRQGLAKVWAKSEAQESHFMLLGVQESVRE